ncbi:MAG: hypothetical protein LW832_07300 [Parachlamydia sp.]|nr:hypothetical protein [Parachlamydia sp.]
MKVITSQIYDFNFGEMVLHSRSGSYAIWSLDVMRICHETLIDQKKIRTGS